MKQTYSTPATIQFDVEGTGSGDGVVVATSGREVTSLKLATTESGPALVYLYDSNSATTENGELKWVLDSASGTPDRDAFPNPLVFKNGIYARLMDGAGVGAILCVGIIDSKV